MATDRIDRILTLIDAALADEAPPRPHEVGGPRGRRPLGPCA